MFPERTQSDFETLPKQAEEDQQTLDEFYEIFIHSKKGDRKIEKKEVFYADPFIRVFEEGLSEEADIYGLSSEEDSSGHPSFVRQPQVMNQSSGSEEFEQQMDQIDQANHSMMDPPH